VVLLSSRRARDAAREVLDELDHAAESVELEGTEHQLISHDDARLVTHVVGPDDGPVVVLAHCWTGSQQVWAPVARRLVAQGCRVVRWDQRGHGRSEAGHKGHSVEGLADDLATVLVELDLHDAVLVGHSMGGITVQALAAHHSALFHERTKGAVLVSTAARVSTNPAIKRARAIVRSASVERLIERPGVGRVLIRSTFGRGPHRHHVEATRADYVATPAPVRGDFAEAMAVMDLREGAATIDVPTTILIGSRDTLTPLAFSRTLARTIPGSVLDVLVGRGHMLPYEAPDEVAAAILSHAV
jgi:pimeloyl-ACP methyl ester carboxylesterase